MVVTTDDNNSVRTPTFKRPEALKAFNDRDMREVAIDNRTTPTKRKQTW